MIPKVIHYCWFGGKPIPKEYSLFREEQRQSKIGRRKNNVTRRGRSDFHFASFRMLFEIFH